jgi:N-methylhydantoinase A
MLGNLAPDSTLAGGVALDRQAAEAAVGKLAGSLGIETLEAAEGIVRIANQEMVRALRVITIERGVDPRGFALLPFGGAGPMHAAAIAAEMGMERILCPRAGGVLSAFGLCASDRRRDTTRTVMLSGEELSAERIGNEVEELRARIATDLEVADAEVAFELPVPGPVRPDPEDLVARFERAHEERYGHRDPDGEVVLVDIRLALVVPGPHPRPVADPRAGVEESSRRVRFEGGWMPTPVLRGEPPAGLEADGPAVFELPEATFVLPPGWSATVDETGTIRAEASP